jgi:hypothetical protein
MTSKFNPFDKEISKLEASDLAILRDVYEGWFVDYKQEIIQAKDLAKQIAAFANSNGGWLFIGIKEKDGKERTASEFLGITDIDRALRTVRDAASVHIHPQFTGYTCEVIKGPNDEIGLEEDRAIIVIKIQAGLEPPYIHSSGQIYRRFDDESRPEKDRLELDKLYAKSEKFNEKFINYYTRQPTLFNPEEPRLFLYFVSDPRESYQEEQVLITFDEFKDVTQGHKEDGVNRPYDTFYRSAKGYTARQTYKNNPRFDVPTFSWNLCGDAFVEIPLNIINLECIENSIRNQWKRLKEINSPTFDIKSAFDQFKEFTDVNYNLQIKTIDYTVFPVSVSAAVYQFLHLRQRSKIRSSPFVKAKLINVGHTIAFFDSPKYIDNVLAFGVPITRYDEIWYPPNKRFDSFEPIELDHNSVFRGADLIISGILKSVGLLHDFRDNDTYEELCKSSFDTANRIDQQ